MEVCFFLKTNPEIRRLPSGLPQPEMQSGTSFPSALCAPFSAVDFLVVGGWVFSHGGDTLTAVDLLVFSKVKNKLHVFSRRHSSQTR